MTHLNSAVDDHEKPLRGPEPYTSEWVIVYLAAAGLGLTAVAMWVLA